jgi:phosphoglycolate phosphatase
MTRLTIDALLPQVPFDAVWGDLPRRPRKPDPGGARQLAAQLGVPAAETLLLGDMPVDMQAARGAGMYALGALWGLRSAGELAAAGAQMLLARPGDLMPWLGKNG